MLKIFILLCLIRTRVGIREPGGLYQSLWSSLKIELISLALTTVKHTYRCDWADRFCGIYFDVSVASRPNISQENYRQGGMYGTFIWR